MSGKRPGAATVLLGKSIEPCDERNESGQHDVSSVRGVSIEKKLIPTKADMEGVSLKAYKVLKPKEFCFVPDTSRRSDHICLAPNLDSSPYLVSAIYEVFRIRDESRLLPEYLHLFFSRPEFDRYARFNSWGSARETFTFADMCRVKLPLPPIGVQRSVVEVWQGLRRMKEDNERLSALLMAACKAQMCAIKDKSPKVALGGEPGNPETALIESCDERNEGGKYDVPSVRGVSIEKKLIPTKADMGGVNLKSYKVLKPGEFAVVTVTSWNGGRISLACNLDIDSYLVSSTYDVFRVTDDKTLCPEYLYLFFSRPEFDRYARFHSWGSARETFTFADMCRVEIPLPPLGVQEAVVALYRCAAEAKKIAEEADAKLKSIGPALVKWAEQEGA